ncbi:MAG: hypothetical protein VXX80_08925 [Bacteroidota bacterium]|nr:hypothetical protein [Bacteroidota bacterium]
MQVISSKRFLQFFLFLSLSLTYAQEKELDKAAKKFESYAFIDAQKIYLRLAGEGYESEELFKKLGDSYYFNGKYEESAKWYKKLYDKYPESLTPEDLFRYAQSLKGVQQYEASDRIMELFRKEKSKDSRA